MHVATVFEQVILWQPCAGET